MSDLIAGGKAMNKFWTSASGYIFLVNAIMVVPFGHLNSILLIIKTYKMNEHTNFTKSGILPLLSLMTLTHSL